MPRLLSLQQIADEYFGMTRQAVQQMLTEGRMRGVPFIRVGGDRRIFIRREHLEAWLDENTHVVPPPAEDESKGSGEKPRTKRKKRSA